MNWLFWVLLVLLMFFVIQGFRRGLIRTAVSMFSVVIVMAGTMWLTPYIGNVIRENTDWPDRLEEKVSGWIAEGVGGQLEESAVSPDSLIEEIPLPEIVKEKLIENTNGDSFQQLAVEGFADYLSGYIAAGILNGITFLVSFVLVTILMKLILYAVDLITELPVIGGFNRFGGGLLGSVQGILWIWIIFLVLALAYDTEPGKYFMGLVKEDPVLLWIYNRNYLVQMLMGIVL